MDANWDNQVADNDHVQCLCSSLQTLPGGVYHRTVDDNKGGVSICLVGLNYKMLLKNYRNEENKENLRSMELTTIDSRISVSCPRMQAAPKKPYCSTSTTVDKCSKMYFDDSIKKMSDGKQYSNEGRNKNVQLTNCNSHTALLMIRNESTFRPCELSAFRGIDSLSLACVVCKSILASAKQIWLRYYRNLRCKSMINVCIKCGESVQLPRFCPFCVFKSTVNCTQKKLDVNNQLFKLISCLKSHSEMCKKARSKLDVGFGSSYFKKNSKRNFNELNMSQLFKHNHDSDKKLDSQVPLDYSYKHSNISKTNHQSHESLLQNSSLFLNSNYNHNYKSNMYNHGFKYKVNDSHGNKSVKNLPQSMKSGRNHNTLPKIVSKKKSPVFEGKGRKHHNKKKIDVASTIESNSNGSNVNEMEANGSNKIPPKKPKLKTHKARNKRELGKFSKLAADRFADINLNSNKVLKQVERPLSVAYTIQNKKSTEVKNLNLLHEAKQIGLKYCTSLKPNGIYKTFLSNDEVHNSESDSCIMTYQKIFAKAQRFRRWSNCSTIDLDEAKRGKHKVQSVDIIDPANYKLQGRSGDMSASQYSDKMIKPTLSKTSAQSTKVPLLNRTIALSLKPVFQYKLSDVRFIKNGWTQIPIEPIFVKINIYKSKFSEEKNWFDNHINEALYYDTGEKLSDGDYTIYYKNGQMAVKKMELEGITIYELYELHPEYVYRKEIKSQRIGVFDGLGNCIIFDNVGNVRLKYNQYVGDYPLIKRNKWNWYTIKREKRVLNLGTAVSEESLTSQSVQLIKLIPIIMRINEKFTLRIRSQNNIWLTYIDGRINIKLSLGCTIEPTQIINVHMLKDNELGEPLGNVQLFSSVNGEIRTLQRKEKERIIKFHSIYGSYI